MNSYRSSRVSSIPRVILVQRRNKITPTHNQQHYTNNREPWLPKKPRQSSVPIHLRNSTTNNTDGEKFQGGCSQSCLMFTGILITVITLAALIMSLYLLIITSNETTTSSTTTARPLIQITQPNDTISGIYNTTAGKAIGAFGGRYSSSGEEPPKAIDGLLNTKYLNFGNNGSSTTNTSQPGINSGFYVTPNRNVSSVACGLLFATAGDFPQRDPITVTLEGTNSAVTNSTNDWTLIYSGSTGIDPVNILNRSTYAAVQVFSNTIPYRSYRLLVTSQNTGLTDSVQYSEAQILGYY